MRPKRIFKISLTDEARLQTIASFSLSPLRAALIIIAALVVMVIIGFLAVVITPLKAWVPGYFRESQRVETQEALLRVDSIRALYLRNEQYIANLNTVLNTSRPSAPVSSDTLSPLPDAIESLLPASPQEKAFVTKMQESEKFNISVAAPMAAEGMLFYPVTEEGIFTSDSRESRKARIILPEGSSVMAVADGVVLASYFDHSVSGYNVLVQHDNGFVSRYVGIGSPLIGESELVRGGQILSLPPYPAAGRPAEVCVQLWHDTSPLIPYDYISTPHTYTSLQP